MMHRAEIQLQSAGKLTRQISRISATCTAGRSRRSWTTRSITSPHASDHMTLVWFSTLPEENGINDRQPAKSADANT